MPGKPLDDPNKSRNQETADKKALCVEVYATLGVKKAAAAAVGRTLKTINEWEAADEDFRMAMLGAEYRFLDANKSKVKLDNVFAHLFEEYKPPKQEIEQTITDSQELKLLRQLVNSDAKPQQPLPSQQPTD